MKYFINGEDGEFIQDSALIEYYKFNNMRHTVVGCMLGDFDVNGIYRIDEEIKKELIDMPKYFVETIENIDIVSSELKLDRQISFMITYESDKVTLSLIEKLNYEANFKLNSGAYSNINEYVIDEVLSSGVVDKSIVYDRWHIKPYGGQVVDIFNCGEEVLSKYFGLVNRFKYLLKSNRIMLEHQEEIENIEADYSMRIFEMLKRYPKLDEAIRKKIAETLNEKQNFISIDKPYFAKTLNELLDKSIRELLDTLTPEEQESFLSEYHNCLNEINIKRLDLLDLKIKKLAIEKNLEAYLVLFNAGEITEEDLLELANSYVMVLKNGRLNPRFDLVWFLISIGVLESSIGYEKFKEDQKAQQTVVVKVEKSAAKKVEKSAGDKKKEDKKDKKKSDKKDKKKEDKKDKKAGSKSDKKDKKEEGKNLVAAATTKRRKTVFAGFAASSKTTEPVKENDNAPEIIIRTGSERRPLSFGKKISEKREIDGGGEKRSLNAEPTNTLDVGV